MKCINCQYEDEPKNFRYLYNARIDASISMRQCPKCLSTIAVDELKGEVQQVVGPGEAPWGKSAGVESLADDYLKAA